MLDPGCYDVFFVGIRADCGPDRRTVTLRTAAVKNDFFRSSANQGGHVSTGLD